MAEQQEEFRLPPRSDESEENEQDREARLHAILYRRMEEAADEVGRARISYALNISEGLLSRKLRAADDKTPDARLLAYLIKHERSSRLAAWLMRDYGGYLVPQRPDLLTPEQALSEVLGLALAGEVGNAAAARIKAIYSRTRKEKP